ncbi:MULTISPECIES: 2-oxo-4-hydroxy-4-carboxy-5-ureidoimidazoline decarboxylase [unclassified Nocardia]|uniref:2-oxo-4-hydroxy-4-carboxy-5-ureidoimidazoline decarboxylase n=1 Tax=unclassified Nocardia TaxID=2637762 RepID=UPI001CE463B7|nr:MULTISPECIES: 2-oxo-4-hydroxy-4-carboxy-5-ureidoimidazoline decarboxylase [unclassified Nocardia]
MLTIDEFNRLGSERLLPALLECCDVPRWANALLGARPYRDLNSLLDTSDRLAGEFTPAEVDRASTAHPRIGERRDGADRGAAWSRAEQSGISAAAATALAAANRRYENRFGRVFLICATGLTADEVLTALTARLDNDEETEIRVIAAELRKIARLRLRKVIAE